MKVSEVLQAIQEGQFSDTELRNINQVLVARLKASRNVANVAAKASLEVGMTVKVNHPQLAGRTFELVEIKRTKAHIRPRGEMFGGYNVPLSLLVAS
ncbi:MAG: hypothetical protein ACO306_04930 [Flavobacteriaceae bacterium]